MSGYKWTLGVKFDPNQPRVPAGGPGGGRWTSGGGFPGSPLFGRPGGTASATTHPDGTITVRREDYEAMNSEDRRWLIAHEVMHATVEDYHEKHPDEWDESKRLLYRETVKRGAYEGLDAFYPWTINLAEAVAEALASHIRDRGEFSNMPAAQWQEFRTWASGLVRRAGYSEEALKSDIDRIRGELDAMLEG